MPSKKNKKIIKVRDLKPAKNPKGGATSLSDIKIIKPIDKSTP